MSENSEATDDMFERRVLTVDAGQSAVRIDRFLSDRLERVSRSKIQHAVKTASILVNGEPVKANYKVRPMDEITIFIPRKFDHSGEVKPENIPLRIEYEDDHILIVYKEAGMVVHPGVGNRSGTLVNALAYYFRQEDLPVMEGNPEDRPGLVHRIDKDTSGLLIIAKNDIAMTHLAKQFFDHTIEREYVAIVWGAPDPPEGSIRGFVGRDPKHRKRMTVFPFGDGGKEAVTHYKTLEDLYYVSLVQCTLETGRTHQIRVHMKSIGHPVFNDAQYGGDRIRKGTVFTKYKQFVQNCFAEIPRQALHARTLGFVHPHSGQHMRFESNLPDDFEAVLAKWRNYLKYRKDDP